MKEESLDKATKIREGETLNETALLQYLQQEIEDLGDTIEIGQFPSGFSNLTYAIKAGSQEYVLRRPPFGANIKSAHDMGREYRVLTSLLSVYPKIPKPVLYCENEKIIGAPFYLMERVRGIVLRNKAPKGMELTPDLMRTISENAIDNLADLHQLDIVSTGLIDLGKPEGYNQRQVEGWIKRYYNAETDTIPTMNALATFLQENIPADVAPAFIHNDYKYDNFILSPDNPGEIIAVLDWEMSTVGNPMMDLATTLAYWAEADDSPALKPFNLTWLPGNLNRAEVIARYEAKTGTQVTDMVYYFAFASFKLGVIVQQIYSRYKKGMTKDPRFAMLIEVVKACGKNGMRAIERDRINNLT